MLIQLFLLKAENANVHPWMLRWVWLFSHPVTGEKSFLVAPCCESLGEKTRNFKGDFVRSVQSLVPGYGSITFLLTCCYTWVYYDMDKEELTARRRYSNNSPCIGIRFILYFAALICTLLTSRKAIPNLQPVIAAEHTSRGRLVWFQLKTLELQNDLRHLGSKDHECAVQVVWVFLRKARRLYDTAVGGEVSGTFWACRNKIQGNVRRRDETGMQVRQKCTL